MLNKKLGETEWKRVLVDIGSWRRERSNALLDMVEKTVFELKEQKLERIELPSMSPSQRREVHVIVSEKFPEIATESAGEEPNRRIVLFKKS
jgi:predicted RNA-binding protein Jag